MPTRTEVLELRRLGRSFEAIGRELAIPPGLAYMLATGIPADGSMAASAEELEARGAPVASSQTLVNPRPHNPTRDEKTMQWVQARARRELTRGGNG